jgi:hypothetical protein
MITIQRYRKKSPAEAAHAESAGLVVIVLLKLPEEA